jgi:hypothetical protein
MKHFGARNQIESLRTVLCTLLDLHFRELTMESIVPTSFARQEYEVEIASPSQGRTAWLEVTQEELDRATAGNLAPLHESLTRFARSVGFLE